MEERKIITKTTLHEMKVHIKKKGKVHIMNFSDKRKVDIMDFWSKRRSFSTQIISRKMIFFEYLRNFPDILRTQKDDFSVLPKSDKMIFYVAWNTIFTDY